VEIAKLAAFPQRVKTKLDEKTLVTHARDERLDSWGTKSTSSTPTTSMTIAVNAVSTAVSDFAFPQV